MSFITLAILLLITILLIWIFKYKTRLDLANKISGPKGVPIVGYYKLFTLPPDELLNHLIGLTKIYKDLFKVWVGPELWAVVYDPKITEAILTDTKLVKSNDYNFLKPWLGNGLLINEGKSWFAKRKAITPAFHFNILEDFIEIFVRQTNIFVDKLKTKEELDVAPLLLLLAFDIISESAMGMEMNAQMDTTHNYIQSNQNISRIAYKRMFNPFLAIDWIFWFTKDFNIFRNSLKIVHETNQRIISTRRAELQIGTMTEQALSLDEFGRKKKMALLDILLKISVDGKLLSDNEIEDEVSTFMFAGHDTTGTALSFLLYSIAKYPEIQKKVSEEIFNIFGEHGNLDITLKGLNELKYLDLVIKESMRIYTTVPFIGRQILEENQIGNNKFPSDTNVSLFVYGMCHREDLYPEPEKFIPERFDITTSAEKLNPFAFIPFSAGHRNCIGQKFAILEMKTVVTKILQNYQISLVQPEDKLILMAGVVLKSKNGINLKIISK